MTSEEKDMLYQYVLSIDKPTYLNIGKSVELFNFFYNLNETFGDEKNRYK